MKIYIGNMSFDTTEDDLRQTFSSFGEVADINIITDRDSGRPRGFAFVEMPDAGAASSAIAELNGTELGGRQLTVNEAKPRENRGGGGGGGYRKRSW
ncbi:RNA-binding protein [candidate division GN15 bacterium]|nr:RNA-binding protein [candidate division GN15 bacterium]